MLTYIRKCNRVYKAGWERLGSSGEGWQARRGMAGRERDGSQERDGRPGEGAKMLLQVNDRPRDRLPSKTPGQA